MEPGLIALLMTILGGVGLKLLENWMRAKHSTVQSLPYNRRWENPSYVHMIHTTREHERQLGIRQTECHCPGHSTNWKVEAK